MNNLRQIGQAAMLYKDENHDAYPYGNRITGPGTNTGSVIDPYGWPMQLLKYLGDNKSTNQPPVYLCPSETGFVPGWVFQMHYQANRVLLSDVDASLLPAPVLGSQVRNPAIFWMFIEKGPADWCQIRPGGLNQPVLSAWNIPPGFPQYRRHNGGMSSVAADGHVEWLRMPPYQPGAPPPVNFMELGDCASGVNPASTWQDPTTPGNHNGHRVKLYSRYQQVISGSAF